MGVTLASIADDGDLLALDQVQVGVAIVINTHGTWSSWSLSSANGRFLRRNSPAAVLLGRSGSRGKSLGRPPLFSIPLPFYLQPSGIEECEPNRHAPVFYHLRHTGCLLEAIGAQAGKANTAPILQRIRLQKNTK